MLAAAASPARRQLPRQGETAFPVFPLSPPSLRSPFGEEKGGGAREGVRDRQA